MSHIIVDLTNYSVFLQPFLFWAPMFFLNLKIWNLKVCSSDLCHFWVFMLLFTSKFWGLFHDYLLVVLIWVFLLLVVLCIWSCFFIFYMKSFLGFYINVALIFRCLFPFTKLLCMKMWHYVWNHPHVALYNTTEFFAIFFWKFWYNVRPEKHFEL